MTADADDIEASPLVPQPVTEERRRALGLLAGWPFHYAPARYELACWLCGESAMFYAPGEHSVMAFCLRHARDF